MTPEELEQVISAERIYKLHDAALAAHGGLPGMRPGCIEGVVGSAVMGCIYGSAETGDAPDVLSLLAHLMRGLNGNHCFNDGNKRVTWMVVEEVLVQQGLQVALDEDAAIAFIHRIIAEHLSPQAILAWFLDRIESTIPQG